MKPLFIFALTLLCPGTELLAAEKRPNIAIILADDLGYSDIGCYGSEIQTPNLDALASDGLRYTSFYNATRCCPSRASLLTGLYPHQAGMGGMEGNNPGRPGYLGHLPPSSVTIASALRPAGYRTMMSGKWHVGLPPGPVQAGFEEFYGFRRGYGVDYFDPDMMIRLPAEHPDERQYEPAKFYSTDAITDHALDFVAAARRSTPDKPWFLFLSYNAAHFPLQAPAVDIEKYQHVYEQGWDAIRAGRMERLQKLGLLPKGTELSARSLVPEGPAAKRDGFEGKTNPAWDTLPPARRADLARRMAVYAATIDHMDQQIGRFVADLKAHGEFENTLVFFLSDNGACAEWDPWGFDFTLAKDRKAEPGVGVGMGTPEKESIVHEGDALAAMGGPDLYFGYGSAWANACNTPFRMYKHYVHEGGISTPLIVHWPAGFAARNETRPQPGHVLDLMSTCLDAAGAQYPAKLDGHDITPTPGQSLLPTFASGSTTSERDFLAWEHEGNRAVRRGNWKLVSLVGGKWELYDLTTDRTELHDLASQKPEVVSELSRLYDEWAVHVGAVEAPKVTATPPMVSD